MKLCLEFYIYAMNDFYAFKPVYESLGVGTQGHQLLSPQLIDKAIIKC